MTHVKATAADRQRLSAIMRTYITLREAEAKTTGRARTAIRKAIRELAKYPIPTHF